MTGWTPTQIRLSPAVCLMARALAMRSSVVHAAWGTIAISKLRLRRAHPPKVLLDQDRGSGNGRSNGGLIYSVLGLGDSSYPKYNVVGRKLDVRLKQLGAERPSHPLARSEGPPQARVGISGWKAPYAGSR